MNRLNNALAVLVFSLSLGACLSFNVKAPLPSENRLEMIRVCRDVKEADGSLVPSAPWAEFTENDTRVCCFVRVQSGDADVRLRWKWYSPDKKLWKDTGPIAVPEDQSGLTLITAYDVLKTDGGDIQTGEWIVAVFVNEVLAGRMKFKVLVP